MRAKCLDCCLNQYDEVRFCQAYDCNLYPYRLGKRPTERDTRIHLDAINKKVQVTEGSLMIKKEDTNTNDTYLYKYNKTRSQWRASFKFLGSYAWNKLTPIEQHVYYYLFTALIWKKKKKKDMVYECVNNGGIEVSFAKMREKIPMTSKTMSKAIKNLIGVGLIRLTRVGENKKCHMYELLGEGVVEKKKQRWLSYPEKDWYHEAPKHPNNLVGKKSRWKKGKSGNPNFKSHPTKVNGKDDKRTTDVSYKNGNGLPKYID